METNNNASDNPHQSDQTHLNTQIVSIPEGGLEIHFLGNRPQIVVIHSEALRSVLDAHISLQDLNRILIPSEMSDEHG